MKKIIQKILKVLAKLILKKYKPKVIGITGSVGKTGTKEAINYILKDNFYIRTNPKNYNNEYGLPLTIIGSLSPNKSAIGWLKVIFKAISFLIIKKDYPEILILEMGIDRPGDMDYLTSIVKPDISLVTAVSHSHFEFFSSLEKIKEEKQKIVKNTKNSGLVILNSDDKLVYQMKELSQSSVLTYGLNDLANLKAFDINYRFEKNQEYFGGLHVKLNHNGSVLPLKLDKIISQAGLYSVLAAILVGSKLGLNLVDISSKLKKYALPPGRMNYLKGINNCHIIDDSYNASPASTISAIKTMARLKVSGKKYLVLGDLLEIGNYQKTAFNLLAQEIKKNKIDHVLLKGDLIKDLKIDLEINSYPRENLNIFFKENELIDFLKNHLKADDLVLIKGSQGARMEKITKEIMEDKKLAKDLLVRQDKEWEN
jgi:UDP-N-acetylmuramoyl-tripeptide--D-alanyl-D-alanine ligase